jgi:hypothetical protein
MNKTWFAIHGELEPFDYPGPTFFRFPLELAERVIIDYSTPGDWVLDPFCGFGTTLIAAGRLGRQAIRFEKDAALGHYAAGRVVPPSRVLVDDVRQAPRHALPRFDLLFTSPPYTTFRDWDDEGFASYDQDLRSIFTSLAELLRPEAKVVLDMCNVGEGPTVRTVAWRSAAILADVFRFEGEVVRCNTGREPADQASTTPTFSYSRMRPREPMQ